MRPSVRNPILYFYCVENGLGFLYCIESAWKKWPKIWHADVSRWLTLSKWILLLVWSVRVYGIWWLCICWQITWNKIWPFGFFFLNLSPRSSLPTLKCDATRPRRASRACVKPFLFPVKSRRSLADFNTESILCCLAQRVIWQFCCIIIKIKCCLLCFVAGAMSMCVEIRET